MRGFDLAFNKYLHSQLVLRDLEISCITEKYSDAEFSRKVDSKLSEKWLSNSKSSKLPPGLLQVKGLEQEETIFIRPIPIDHYIDTWCLCITDCIRWIFKSYYKRC